MNTRRLLIVDDELSLQDSYILELKAEGYDVVSVSTIVDAEKKLSSEHFDLVILDVMMPVELGVEAIKDSTIMNVGLHFAAEIKKRYPGIHLLIFTNSHYHPVFDSFTATGKPRCLPSIGPYRRTFCRR